MANAKGITISNMWAAPTSASVSITTRVLDSSGASVDRVATILQVGNAFLIEEVGFYYGVRTGTPPEYKVSLQGVDGSGNPDGTIKNGGAAVVTFTPPADTSINNTWQRKTIAGHTTSPGEWIAIVIEYSSGTINASNNSSFGEGLTGIGNYTTPYNLRQLNGGSWTKVDTIPTMAIFGGSLSIPYGFGFPVQSIFQTDIATNGHKQAMSFDLAGVFGDVTIRGFRFLGKISTGGSVKFFGPTPAIDFTVDSDWFGTNASFAYHEIIFQTQGSVPIDLTTYRVGIERVDVAVGIRGITVASASDMLAFYGGESLGGGSMKAHLATWDGSNWTEDYTTRLFAELIIGSAL